jgi:hypothetical protein
VVDDQIYEHPNAALFRSVGEFHKIAEAAVAGINRVMIRDVIPIVAIGRDLEGHQPDGRDPQAMQIVETARQTLEVTDAVAVGVLGERA